MHKKTDKRIVRTQELIFNSLLHFMEKGCAYSETSIQDLSDEAGIARQTFYRNYLSKDDVILLRLDEIMECFMSKLTDFKILHASDLAAILIKYWSGEFKMFELLEWAGLEKKLIDKLSTFNKKIIMQNEKSVDNIEYIANYYAGAIYMFLKTFIASKRHDNLEEIIGLFCKLTNNCCALLNIE